MKEPNWWERFRAWLVYLIFPELSDWYVEACERANQLEAENAALKRELMSLKVAYYRANNRRWKLEEDALLTAEEPDDETE